MKLAGGWPASIRDQDRDGTAQRLRGLTGQALPKACITKITIQKNSLRQCPRSRSARRRVPTDHSDTNPFLRQRSRSRQA